MLGATGYGTWWPAEQVTPSSSLTYTMKDKRNFLFVAYAYGGDAAIFYPANGGTQLVALVDNLFSKYANLSISINTSGVVTISTTSGTWGLRLFELGH